MDAATATILWALVMLFAFGFFGLLARVIRQGDRRHAADPPEQGAIVTDAAAESTTHRTTEES